MFKEHDYRFYGLEDQHTTQKTHKTTIKFIHGPNTLYSQRQFQRVSYFSFFSAPPSISVYFWFWHEELIRQVLFIFTFVKSRRPTHKKIKHAILKTWKHNKLSLIGVKTKIQILQVLNTRIYTCCTVYVT